jgi:hypothetical protein
MFRHRTAGSRSDDKNDWVATGNTGADVIVSPVDSEGAAGPANNKAKNAIRSFGDVSLDHVA